MIQGIFRDAPVNSHLKPDILVSWETLVFFDGPDINTAWQWDGFFNYILLNPSSDYKDFEAKIPAFVYVNISTTRSLERARETGMRKVAGASRNQLVVQFLMESVLINIFALILAIIIACLGLFGLSSYTTIRRIREVGIRKVMGSSTLNCILLLMRFFVIQVLIAVPVGLGIGYFVMLRWLNNFAYRINIGWWFFLLPVCLLVIITILTVSSQIIKTANTNPATSLRNE